MAELIWLAAISMIQVFAMAFQSKNINGGHYVLAACGSAFIGLSQAFVWKAITDAGATLTDTLVYAASGGLGCVLAMYAHQRLVRKKVANPGSA